MVDALATDMKGCEDDQYPQERLRLMTTAQLYALVSLVKSSPFAFQKPRRQKQQDRLDVTGAGLPRTGPSTMPSESGAGGV